MASTEQQMVLDMLRLGSPLAGTTIAEMRANMEATAGAVPPPPDVGFETVRMGGVPAEWARAGAADGGALLYLHGGGYCVGSIGTHRLLVAELRGIWDIADRFGGVTLFDAAVRQGLDTGYATIGFTGPNAPRADFTLLRIVKASIHRCIPTEPTSRR